MIHASPTITLMMTVLYALGAMAHLAGPVQAATEPQKVAFVGFRIINDSMEPLSEAEKNRARLLDALFKQKLEATGRFKFVGIPEAVRDEIASGPFIGECNGCEVDYGRKLGADLIAWGTVQKVSNLILNLNVYMGSVETGQMTYIKSVDIRGNTDTSWTKGLEWMLKYYMPGAEPAGQTQ
ncbi:MAG: hypothetical protein APF80_10535 [Alphaproteobacteria bacterium BRH_c36]|nr:MAG: hypothetical protein APF80_10535 [Alphaproteobacteria bacterium BRH_c36]